MVESGLVVLEAVPVLSQHVHVPTERDGRGFACLDLLAAQRKKYE